MQPLRLDKVEATNKMIEGMARVQTSHTARHGKDLQKLLDSRKLVVTPTFSVAQNNYAAPVNYGNTKAKYFNTNEKEKNKPEKQ